MPKKVKQLSSQLVVIPAQRARVRMFEVDGQEGMTEFLKARVREWKKRGDLPRDKKYMSTAKLLSIVREAWDHLAGPGMGYAKGDEALSILEKRFRRERRKRRRSS